MKNVYRCQAAVLIGTIAILLSACGVQITSVSIPDTAVLEKGESQSLQITYTTKRDADAEAVQKAADKLETMWSTSDETVATVDEAGLVTAIGPGTAEITMTAGKISDSCEITVVIPAKGIDVTNSLSLVVNKDSSQALSAKSTPEDATDIMLTYQSSNPAVATVDKDGVVNAVANGEAIITTTLTQSIPTFQENSTSESASKTITHTAITNVVVTTAIESIVLDNTEGILTVGDSHTIKATVKPSNATDQTLKWSSTDQKVATVDANGKVTAKSEGSATITASNSDGDVSASYELTVKKVTCSYCGQSGHTSSSCPVKAADQKKAAQQAAAQAAAQAAQQQAAAQAAQQQAAAQSSGSSGGGGTTSAPAPAPAPAPDPAPSGDTGSSGGVSHPEADIPGQIVTGGGNGDGSDDITNW